MKTLIKMFLIAIFLMAQGAGVATLSAIPTPNSVSPGYVKFVTRDEALSSAKSYFTSRDADYYLANRDSTTTDWQIFVDANPTAGWCHECYLFSFPRRVTSFEYGNPIAPSRIDTLQMPPHSNFSPLDVKDRLGENAHSKPNVAKREKIPAKDIEAAENTRVIIISGGGNKLMNHERYWNDCSFIYQTLTKKYGIPKSNIHVLMSDGTSTEEDMNVGGGYYESSNPDLDGDGVPDVEYAATIANLKSVLWGVKNGMKKDQQLFIFVTDHGFYDSAKGSSIVMWGENEFLFHNDFADLISRFTNSDITVNVVMGQCYSGGFVYSLNQVGCVVATACGTLEYSYAHPGFNYDSFLYHWTSALNGADHRGVKVNADIDNSGTVTSKELFDYASLNRMNGETPQYQSTPKTMGDYLAFNDLVKTVDLYIRDTPFDRGKEPTDITNFWNSPDIWIRNQDDNIQGHENPTYSDTHKTAFAYTRIINRGKKASSTNFNLNTYWSDASTSMHVNTWKGRELVNGRKAGDLISTIQIPVMQPGETKVLNHLWNLEKVFEDRVYKAGQNHHFCILSQIMEGTDDPYAGSDYSDQLFPVREDRRLAQKNVSIITAKDSPKPTIVFVGNPHDYTAKFSLEFQASNNLSKPVFDRANIELAFSKDIDVSNIQSEGMDRIPGTSSFKLTSSSNRLADITLKPNQTGYVAVLVKYKSKPIEVLANGYTIDLIQRDENGCVVGGETFIIEEPLKSDIPSLGLASYVSENGTNLYSTNELASYIWTDEEGVIISTDSSVLVKPSKTSNTYSLIATDSTGETAMECISIDPAFGIECIVPPSASHQSAIVHLLSAAGENDSVTVSTYSTGNTVCNQVITPGDTSLEINCEQLPDDTYIITYISDGQVVGSAKFVKQL